MTDTFVERELKFDIDPSFHVPDVTAFVPEGGTTAAGHEHLRSDYFDTADHALLSAHLTLRRRTGSTDTGWQLKVPHPPFRQEIRFDDPTETVPEELADLLLGARAGAPLVHIATLTTERSTVRLLDAGGAALAEIDDDTVHAVVPGEGESATAGWQELEVELGGDDLDLLALLGERLVAAGARPSASPSKLDRALRSTRSASATEPEFRTAGDVLGNYLAEQRRVMIAGDIALRRGDDTVIHKTRVATRRWRSTLRTFATFVDVRRAEALDEELKWFAGLMGEIRDCQVLDRRLEDMVGELDDRLVLGPVLARIRGELSRERGEHWARLQEEMGGERYLALLAEVGGWVHEPPLTEMAEGSPETLKKALKKGQRKVADRLADANASGDPSQLHSTRKAAKRARYAAETVEPVIGAQASAKVTHRYEKLQDLLGEHQDSLVSAEVLRRLGAIAGTTEGENGFTFGILYEREEQRAAASRKRAARRAKKFS